MLSALAALRGGVLLKRRPDLAGTGTRPGRRARMAVAARSAGTFPQTRADRLARAEHPRGPQPPGPAHDRRGRIADPAPGADRGSASMNSAICNRARAACWKPSERGRGDDLQGSLFRAGCDLSRGASATIRPALSHSCARRRPAANVPGMPAAATARPASPWPAISTPSSPPIRAPNRSPMRSATPISTTGSRRPNSRSLAAPASIWSASPRPCTGSISSASMRRFSRVLKPRGVVAFWSYADCQRECGGRRHEGSSLRRSDRTLLAAGTRPGRKWLRQPAVSIRAHPSPAFELRMQWIVDQFLAYLRSWSATQAYIRALEQDPVSLIEAPNCAMPGAKPSRVRTVRWDFHLHCGRV